MGVAGAGSLVHRPRVGNCRTLVECEPAPLMCESAISDAVPRSNRRPGTRWGICSLAKLLLLRERASQAPTACRLARSHQDILRMRCVNPPLKVEVLLSEHPCAKVVAAGTTRGEPKDRR